jgi:hypothetical protein
MLPPAQVKYIDDLMRADLLYWRDLWFGWLLLSTKLVVAGLILEGPELIHELFSIRGRFRIEKSGASVQESHTPDWVKIVALLGWLFIVAGVAGEWITDAVISDADSNIQAFNNVLLAEATREAGDAKDSANGAASAAQRATNESNKARTSASNALALADGARREADSFEKDIVSAKRLAADAESHLADALRQAADATAELNRLKSPRLLTNAYLFSAALKKFKGTEYTFSSVFGDEESIELLKQIDSALQLAEWKRVNPSSAGAIVVNVYGNQQDFGVPPGIATGVLVSINSFESVNFLKAQPQERWPLPIRTASALKSALSLWISPPQGDKGKDVILESGTSTIVRITVGKKP